MQNRESGIQRLNNLNFSKKHKYYLSYVPLIQTLKKCLTSYASGRLLDIGCGNKPYEKILPNTVSEYLGCDIAQSSENKVDIICSATDIPTGNAEFDVVLSTQTIEHVGDYKKMLQEAHRVLKVNGHIILSGPMYWPLHEEPYDYHRFTTHGFRYELEQAGFNVVEIIPNGGKWALLGQVILLTLPQWLLKPKISRIAINALFEFLDKKYPDFSSTCNYVTVGTKPHELI